MRLVCILYAVLMAVGLALELLLWARGSAPDWGTRAMACWGWVAFIVWTLEAIPARARRL